MYKYVYIYICMCRYVEKMKETLIVVCCCRYRIYNHIYIYKYIYICASQISRTQQVSKSVVSGGTLSVRVI